MMETCDSGARCGVPMGIRTPLGAVLLPFNFKYLRKFVSRLRDVANSFDSVRMGRDTSFLLRCWRHIGDASLPGARP